MDRPINVKVTKELKAFVQDAANRERRSLSGFIRNALLVYIEEKHGCRFEEEEESR
jgi:uncharacterized protein (DUF1778 family)